jgi:hypothetical protein
VDSVRCANGPPFAGQRSEFFHTFQASDKTKWYPNGVAAIALMLSIHSTKIWDQWRFRIPGVGPQTGSVLS